MGYRTEIKFQAYFDTSDDPDVIINKLLDRLGEVPTDDLNLSWSDCEWETYVNAEELTNG